MGSILSPGERLRTLSLRLPKRRGLSASCLRLSLCIAACLELTSVAAAAVSSFGESAQLGESPVFTSDSPIGNLTYQPGRGLRIDSPGVVIGGFANVKAEHAEESGSEFTLDSLNLFLILDRFSRFKAVAELQLKDIFIVDETRVGAQDFAFDVRRLFGDFALSDELHVRGGTFLTPVGYWNLILAPPLTWTTEAPLIVEKTFFQQTTTGLMLHGSTKAADGRLRYSLFSQFLSPLEKDKDLDPPNLTAGARLEYSVGLAWTLGATYQAAESRDDWTHLGALHFLWEHRLGELLSELYYEDGSALKDAMWGTYLQGVVEVHRPFFLVARYEHFNPTSPESTLNLFTIGGVYKPLPFMAIKVEYRLVDQIGRAYV